MQARAAAKVNVNTARPRELQELLGLERTLARRVVMERKLFGEFSHVEELTRIEGFTPGLLADLRESIEVGAQKDRTGGLVFAQTQPVVFWGTPVLMRGALWVVNEGRSVVKGISVRVNDAAMLTANGRALDWLSSPGIVGPGEERKAFFSFGLDSSTEPGTYPIMLSIGETTQEARLVVTEHTLLMISPSRFRLPNSPGSTYSRAFVIHNAGNVPAVIGDVGAVTVEEVEGLQRVLRQTVRKSTHPTWDEAVGAASEELKRSLPRETLRVTVGGEAIRIEPSQTVSVDLEINISRRMPRHKHFVAKANFLNALLTINLQPETGAEALAEGSDEE